MPRGLLCWNVHGPKRTAPFASQTIEQESKMKVDLQLWLAAFPCAIPPLPSWRRAHRERKEERETNVRCSHSKKLMGTPGGFARTRGEPTDAWNPLRGLRAELCARLARPPGWPGLSLWPPPARPPGCAPAPLLTASSRCRRPLC